MCVVPEEKEVREGEVRQAMKQGGEDEQKSEGGVMKGRRVWWGYRDTEQMKFNFCSMQTFACNERQLKTVVDRDG